MYPASQKTRSLQNKKNGIKNIYIPFSLDDLKADDERMKEEFLPPRVAVLLPASFSLKIPEYGVLFREENASGNSGSWQIRPRQSLFIIKNSISRSEASYSYITLRILIYWELIHTKLTPEKGKFATEFVAGDDIILEYVAPEGDEFPQNPEIEIEEIGYGYNYLSIKDSYSESLSGSCMGDINCEEGEQWQDHKNGVVKMLYR